MKHLILRAFALTFAFGFAFAAAAQSTSTGSGQAFPAKPIRIVIPFPPGNTVDIMARLIGPKMTERLGQNVIVDNRAGAAAVNTNPNANVSATALNIGCFMALLPGR